jgi:hypothetical protein
MGAMPRTEPLILKERAVQRIQDGKGRWVKCLAGVVWITQADDHRDIILKPGESVLLDRPGLAVIMALRNATITVAEPVRLASAAADLLRSSLAAV